MSSELELDATRFNVANVPNGEEHFHNWRNGKDTFDRNANWMLVGVGPLNPEIEGYTPGPIKTPLELVTSLLREFCDWDGWSTDK